MDDSERKLISTFLEAAEMECAKHRVNLPAGQRMAGCRCDLCKAFWPWHNAGRPKPREGQCEWCERYKKLLRMALEGHKIHEEHQGIRAELGLEPHTREECNECSRTLHEEEAFFCNACGRPFCTEHLVKVDDAGPDYLCADCLDEASGEC